MESVLSQRNFQGKLIRRWSTRFHLVDFDVSELFVKAYQIPETLEKLAGWGGCEKECTGGRHGVTLFLVTA